MIKQELTILAIFSFNSVQTLPRRENLSKFSLNSQVITGHVEVYGICQFPVFDISDRSEEDSKTFLFSFSAYMTPICIIFKSL